MNSDKNIREFEDIWENLTPRQRAAIEFCEMVLNKSCSKDYKNFLKQNLKEAKIKDGWSNPDGKAMFFTDPLVKVKGENKMNTTTQQPIVILNTTILTADGDFSLKTISLDEAKALIDGKEILSAVGHESTAEILTEMLDREIPVNRIQFIQEPGQKALCFKLSGRPREGAILSKEEVLSMNYEFKLLEMK